jgi:cobalt-zinc-cadmium efflux system membrane fusion protein
MIIQSMQFTYAHRRSLHAAMSVLFMGVAACGRGGAANSEQTVTPRIEEVSDTSAVQVPNPERFALTSVAPRTISDRLSGTCVVSPDVNRTVPINALGSGRVLDLRASLGDQVQQGQVLVTIESPDLSSALADYRKAAADASLARKQLDRARLLYEHGSIAQKDVEVAEDAAQKAQVDLEDTESRVKLLGGDPARSTPVIEVRAPVAGTIVEQNVTRAAGVKSPDNEPNLFVSADLSRVGVLCDVYENDLARVHLGAAAQVRLNAYPEKTATGTIANISQVLDSATRTAKVRVEMENATGVMRPGMFATAELQAAAPRNGVVLPTSAIVQFHDADWVVVKVGDKSFRRVQVTTGAEVEPGLQEVRSGLTAGQQVVRNALEFLQSMEQ